MKTETETASPTHQLNVNEASCSKGSCSAAACGGPGLCPGVALLLAYLAGAGVTLLTGALWFGWLVGIPVGLILITGAWRFLPKRPKS